MDGAMILYLIVSNIYALMPFYHPEENHHNRLVLVLVCNSRWKPYYQGETFSSRRCSSDLLIICSQ